MAFDLYSDIASRQNTALTQAGKLVKQGDLVTGNLKVATAEVTTVGDEAANDVIALALIPAGARIIWSLSNLECDTGFAALAANLGTYDLDEVVVDADAGGAALDLDTATPVFGVGSVLGTTSPLTEDTWVCLTLTTSTTPVASDVIVANIVYAVPGN